ncbi:hypothetical protein FACS189472_00980 [Alphaproteobacteria bacterium]|nr:hypothetical protein FACS189472_00980 [Alphaproteobacteria bacterium]
MRKILLIGLLAFLAVDSCYAPPKETALHSSPFTKKGKISKFATKIPRVRKGPLYGSTKLKKKPKKPEKQKNQTKKRRHSGQRLLTKADLKLRKVREAAREDTVNGGGLKSRHIDTIDHYSPALQSLSAGSQGGHIGPGQIGSSTAGDLELIEMPVIATESSGVVELDGNEAGPATRSHLRTKQQADAGQSTSEHPAEQPYYDYGSSWRTNSGSCGDDNGIGWEVPGTGAKSKYSEGLYFPADAGNPRGSRYLPVLKPYGSLMDHGGDGYRWPKSLVWNLVLIDEGRSAADNARMAGAAYYYSNDTLQLIPTTNAPDIPYQAVPVLLPETSRTARAGDPTHEPYSHTLHMVVLQDGETAEEAARRSGAKLYYSGGTVHAVAPEAERPTTTDGPNSNGRRQRTGDQGQQNKLPSDILHKISEPQRRWSESESATGRTRADQLACCQTITARPVNAAPLKTLAHAFYGDDKMTPERLLELSEKNLLELASTRFPSIQDDLINNKAISENAAWKPIYRAEGLLFHPDRNGSTNTSDAFHMLQIKRCNDFNGL